MDREERFARQLASIERLAPTGEHPYIALYEEDDDIGRSCMMLAIQAVLTRFPHYALVQLETIRPAGSEKKYLNASFWPKPNVWPKGSKWVPEPPDH